MALASPLSLALLTALFGALPCVSAKPPHVVFIVADDLGMNDVSMHGSPQIPTPHIDEIGETGVRLMNYHAQPVCSPSRASFLSGRHAIHHGIYMPFSQGTAYRLDLNFTLLPTFLKACCNYTTHAVGKWHLGQNVVAALPEARGFDSHLGYWSGAESYVTHEAQQSGKDGVTAYDFSDGLRIAVEYNGTWSATVLAARAVELINSITPTSPPLFLYLAFQNVHWPLQAPQAYVDQFANSTGGDVPRQMVCAMAAFLDDMVGTVTGALKSAGVWEETLLIFSSDNGGPEHGNEGTSSNNYPLRGGKNTLWEGGTRVVGAVRGAGIQKTGYDSYEKVHATDWLPTLVRAASGENWTSFIPPGEPAYLLGDGVDVWETLSTGAPSPRDWLVLETHPPGAGQGDRVHGDAFILGDMKIVRWDAVNPQEENGWFPPPGQDPSKVLYKLACGRDGPPTTLPDPHQCSNEAGWGWCLFNVTADPCEVHDLAAALPHVVQALEAELARYSATAVPPVLPQGCDPIVVTLPNGALAWQPCDVPGTPHPAE